MNCSDWNDFQVAWHKSNTSYAVEMDPLFLIYFKLRDNQIYWWQWELEKISSYIFGIEMFGRWTSEELHACLYEYDIGEIHKDGGGHQTIYHITWNKYLYIYTIQGCQT